MKLIGGSLNADFLTAKQSLRKPLMGLFMCGSLSLALSSYAGGQMRTVEPSLPGTISDLPISNVKVKVGPLQTILATEEKPCSWPDRTMGVIKDGERYHFFGAAEGTLDDPTAQEVRDLKIENLGKPYHYAAGGPVYEDRGSGTLLMFYHAEFYTFPPDGYHFTAS